MPSGNSGGQASLAHSSDAPLGRYSAEHSHLDRSNGRAYLDHASTSPVRPAALEAMWPWLSAADPGRMHTEGRMARVALEDARAHVAALLGTRPRQVIFTSGATEGINTAIYGALQAARRSTGPASAADGRPARGTRVALAAVEHSAVREASERYAGPDGLTILAVDRTGRIDPDSVRAALADPGVALVHCQWANHEVGTIQPVAEVVGACRAQGVFVHVDAAAAAGHLPVAFDDLGADLMSVSAHKLGGPRGIGALLVRRGLRVPPLLIGGAQERARRAGLENVAAAVGFGAAAAELAAGDTLAIEAATTSAYSDRLRTSALAVAGVEAYGPLSPAERLPYLVCLGIGGVEAEAVLIGLDQAGIAAHSGSACSSELLEPSPVLAAMGVNAERSLRLSVGWSTDDMEVAMAERALPEVVGRLRALAGGG
jgi:cysteine desulfurase